MRYIVVTKGERYGKLTILSLDPENKSKAICKCDCGVVKSISRSHMRQGNTISCGCISKLGRTRPNWKGCGDISGDFWYSHILRSAKGDKQGNKIRRPKELNISVEYIWDLFLKQDSRCALTGLELKFPKYGKDKSYSASLDRIDSSKGYVEGNVQWVHKHINIMKNKFDQSYFREMCKLVNECEINI
jgi:hypothetical protein